MRRPVRERHVDFNPKTEHMEHVSMIDLLVLITLFAFAIPSLRGTRAVKSQLAHIERRLERLEAMQHDVLVKLGYDADEIRAAYPRMARYGESPELSR